MTFAPLSVVVATRDRPALLDACLSSLRSTVRAGDELIVVDSASRDGAAISAIAAKHAARYLRCEAPGASRARNVGWRCATGDVVAFVDDDVRVRSGWANALAAVLTDHPDIGFVTGRIDEPDGAPAERPVAVFDATDPFTITRRTPDPVGHGANHAVRRQALEQVGGFDEHLGPGARFHAGEDVDLWDRLLRAGVAGVYAPTVRSWHEQWRGRRDNLGLDWAYGVGGGARLSKLARSDPPRAAIVARILFWRWGLAMIPRELHFRQPFKASLHAIRICGVVVGLVRALAVPVRGGHLAPRTRRSLGTRG